MFEGMKDMGKLLKQAKEMKSKMQDVQNELKKVTVTGSSSSNKVTFTVTGEMEVLSVNISPELLTEGAEKAQTEVKEAANDAIRKSKELATSKLSAISGGLNLPGLN